MKEANYYYAGAVLGEDGKKVHEARSLTDEKKNLMWRNKKNYFPGETFHIKDNKENSFHIISIKWLPDNDPRVQEARIQHSATKQKIKENQARERAKRERSNIEDMTVREIKEICKKNWQFKATIRAYLMSQF